VTSSILEFGPDGCFGIDVRDDATADTHGLKPKEFIPRRLPEGSGDGEADHGLCGPPLVGDDVHPPSTAVSSGDTILISDVAGREMSIVSPYLRGCRQ